MSDMPAVEVDLVEDPDEIHKIFKQSFIDEQEFYLYKYISSEHSLKHNFDNMPPLHGTARDLRPAILVSYLLAAFATISQAR